MTTGMLAIGIANPPYYSSQEKLYEFVLSVTNLSKAQKKILRSVYKATGIQKRYSVLDDFCKTPGEFTFFPNDPNAPFPGTAARMAIYKANALNLALNAIEDCLKQIPNFQPQSITHLIIVSCTGMYAPGLDIEIIQELDLNLSTQRTAVNFMGCYGAFNGLKLADAISRSNPDAKVLLVCVELCSIHFQRSSDLDNLVSNAIFADGAAAVLLQSKPTNCRYLELVSFYNTIVPQSNREMAWHIGDQGFDMELSSYVPDLVKSGINGFSKKLLEFNKLSMQDIDYFAIHPGGKKILEACEEALDISDFDNRFSYEVMKNYGNMSSATVLFVLRKLWEELRTVADEKNIFSCAFGPGLTLEAMLLKIKAY